MAAVRLGKMHLRWCDSCNVPVLEQGECSKCSTSTREVKITPPGDARPAFDHDIRTIRKLIDTQFGPGCGEVAVPTGRLVLLNKAPDLDRMDEVVLDGMVIGAVRFDIARGEKFLPRGVTASRMEKTISRGWVRVDRGALESIRERSASALAVGVSDAAEGIEPGDDVIVLDPDGKAVSVGVAKMSTADIRTAKRGTAVKTRWVADGSVAGTPNDGTPSWDDAILANREVIDRRVSEAARFVRDVVRKNDLPVAVSFSGGKDSLATLLLVMESGISPKMIFVDTGLEFEETLKNVRDTAARHSLELITESAGDGFWRNVDLFGPPAKDFRWCCKTCKLGPATRLIQKNFPGGVLSFIGQRAYESQNRARKGRVWRNPWTPNQLGASPIQNWTALHVWFYLFDRKEPFNPLYERGFERIGCYLCPSADLAELKHARELNGEYSRWQEYLTSYSQKHDMPEEWLSKDLWRWRRVPRSILDALGLKASPVGASHGRSGDNVPIGFQSTEGYSPCVEGMSMEGVFSRELDMSRVSNLLNVLGEVTVSPDGRIAEVDRITVFAEGPVMIKAHDEEALRTKASRLKEVVLRAMECAGCGICVSRCPESALELDGRVKIDENRCSHCGQCLGPCPVVQFREDQQDI
ncbi:MAG: phosphoadenosine phosphosulfate reductase family protein [Candidatus Thermoplasmatota archaeon]|nr:phosphoadenosine phosphosulfate reductase family protein [Candidatus Thermoplasmatota archaeon]